MRSLIVILALIVLSGSALAARPDFRKMTCQQAQNMVNQRGSVVATTGQYTYKRFVSSFRYCDYWERAATTRVQTKDNPKCRIRFICEERLDDFRFGGRGRY